MTLFLGDFNAKVGKEDIFKPTLGNESLHEIIIDIRVRLVNFATSKISHSKVQYSHSTVFISISGCLQIGKPTIRLTIFCQIGESIQVYLTSSHSRQQIVIPTTMWCSKI
jgi:hypothetical protein